MYSLLSLFTSSIHLTSAGLLQSLRAQTDPPLWEEAVKRKLSKQDGSDGMHRQIIRQTGC